MSTPSYFEEVPTFPSDVPVAILPTISFAGLETGDSKEAARLFQACQYHGFFLLDLKGCASGNAVLDDAENLYSLTKTTMNLDREVLDKFAYNPKVSLIGYKRAGLLKTDDGGFDTTDLYSLGQDDILGNEPKRSNPDPIEARRDECCGLFLRSRKVVTTILDALDIQLGLPQGTLSGFTALERSSNTALRLLLTRPDDPPLPPKTRRVTLGAHTDIGIITLLFNGAGGLQILPAGKENVDANWEYIRPVPGCAVINIGDTLVEWTGRLLRSSLHRVVTAPGAQSTVTRHSFGFFVRPAKEATMKRLHSDNGMIPPVSHDNPEDDRLVDVWAAERAAQVIRGELRPQSFGGGANLNMQSV